MNYAKIIQDSWQLTIDNPKLKWFIFIPNFIAVLVVVLEVLWQSYFLLKKFGFINYGFSWENLQEIANIVSQNDLWGWIIFGIFFIILFYLIVPTWIIGSLILGIQSKIDNTENKISIRKKLVEGHKFFIPLFELHAIASLFSLWSILLFSATLFRYYEGVFQVMFELILGYAIFSIILTIFMSFASFFIIQEEDSVSISVIKSISMVFYNFGSTISLILLMFLVNFRILLNVLVIIGIPIGIFGLVSYLQNITIIITIAIIFSTILITLTAYLTAIVEVFSTTVWIKTFAEFKKKELDN